MTRNYSQVILHQVPPNYYQKGIENNLFQRIWHTGKLSAVLNLIDFYPRRILDVGSASGWFLAELSRNYPKAKCVGVDAYEVAITYGSKLYKSVKFVHADAHKLPFPDASFDLVICTEVLEHVLNPKGVLMEMKRVIGKNGVAIIEMDTGNILFNIIWFLWINIKGRVWKDAHLHRFNSKKLARIIKKCGFSIKKTKTFNFGMAIAFYSKKI